VTHTGFEIARASTRHLTTCLSHSGSDPEPEIWSVRPRLVCSVV